ncbi:hypothetical protein [Gimesia sp.]|uniref:hypothetical protein n=1 Tax=Gimesia sp. TaxID=2024833 RepID=UPI003A8F6950
MKNLKNTLINLGLFALVLIGCFTIPVGVYVASDAPQATASPAVQTEQSVTATMPPELMLILKQIAENPAPKTHTARQIQPIPDPMIEAINRMERNYQQLVKQIADRDEKMSDQLTKYINASYRAGSKVDRSGNTKEQLEDIYQDANVPQLPDAMVKGLAANPGARAMIHPDHGQPVIAVTEWGVSNYGGGKQLNLLRHNGRVYGQTVIHGDQSISQKTQPPQQEKQPAFNLNLGNN